MSTAEKVSSEIQEELDTAVRDLPTWPTDPLHALAVLGEKYGALSKAVLQLTYAPHKEGSSVAAVRREAVHTAVMALRFVMSLDQYRYGESKQHRQEEGSDQQ